MISKETIQEIFEAAQIDEVVGEFVSLKKRGVNLLGLCPFHNEKTPSFTVSPKKGIYKCFGCGKGGNSVQFLMDHEQFTYPEALKYLAKKYNIEIEEKEQTPEEIKLLNEKESLFHVTDFAAKYFASNIFDSEQGRAIGLSYFKERGFREDTIKKFQLGYAIDAWDNFTAHAIKMGYNIDYLEKTGLTIVKDNKTYFKVNDYQKLREIFGIQLCTIQRIKSQGDYQMAKELVEKYGVVVDKKIHEEVLARWSKLNIPAYSGFINPSLKALREEGKIIDIEITYPNDFSKQMLGYSQNYSM